jgi:hypothetical protein
MILHRIPYSHSASQRATPIAIGTLFIGMNQPAEFEQDK